MILENTHIEPPEQSLLLEALSDLAGLALHALSADEPRRADIARVLLNRLMRLSGATYGSLVVQQGRLDAAARLQPLALSSVTMRDLESLLAQPLYGAFDMRTVHGGGRWLRYELPTHATSRLESAFDDGGHASRTIALLGWPEGAPESSVERALGLMQAVAEAAGAVVAALLLHRQPHEATASSQVAGAVAETDTTWEQIFDAVSDPMCVVTAEYRLERANAAYMKLFGLSRHGIPGHECYAQSPGQTGPCADCPLPQTLRSGEAAFVQQERLVPTGGKAFERRIFQRWTYPIYRSDGSVGRIVEILKDVTDQEQARKAMNQAEALREADRLKSELLGTVSHELRSPLTTIKGYAATLLRHERRLPREERHEFLSAIVEASDSLQVIIDRLLEMSQIETGALRVERVDINLQELARAALDAIEHTNAEGARKFDFELTPAATDSEGLESPWEVTGDPRLLREMLDNLLENAVKYSLAGGHIQVRLSARAGAVPATPERKGAVVAESLSHARTSPRGGTIELVVSDTGMGIPQEHLEHIFERFHRVDTRLTREVGGLGLGLAICQRIVERHGGIIWAESAPGAGSSFHVELPAASSSSDNAG